MGKGKCLFAAVLALGVSGVGVTVIAPTASAATACVEQTLKQSNTYQSCVVDLQVLLNDLWYSRVKGPNQKLATDGYFGPLTASDVASFNYAWQTGGGNEVTFNSWNTLCNIDWFYGYRGTYWNNAGCPLLVYG